MTTKTLKIQILETFKILPTWFQVVVFVSVSTYFLIGKITDNIIKVKEAENNIKQLTLQQATIKVKNDSLLNEIKDSLKRVKFLRDSKRNIQSKFEIKKEAELIKEQLPNCVAVNYISVHNGGGVIKVDENSELDVNVSSDLEVAQDFNVTRDNKQPMWSGLVYWTNLNLSEGFVCIQDVTTDADFYTGRLKTYLTVRGVQSTASMFIGYDTKNLYFISFDFSKTNFDKEQVKAQMIHFRKFIKNRIKI
jgi:hypothetical protein